MAEEPAGTKTQKQQNEIHESPSYRFSEQTHRRASLPGPCTTRLLCQPQSSSSGSFTRLAPFYSLVSAQIPSLQGNPLLRLMTEKSPPLILLFFYSIVFVTKIFICFQNYLHPPLGGKVHNDFTLFSVALSHQGYL